jgi:hypothetical protein
MIDELIKGQDEAKASGDNDLDFFTDTHIAQTIANVLVGGRSDTRHLYTIPVARLQVQYG